MNWIAHKIRMPDDNNVKKMLQFKVTGIWKHGRRRLKREILRGISLWDYKGENLNESKKEAVMEESPREALTYKGLSYQI
ncbi:hypothetical protein TNCV_1338931 [Trichonephila clavipes]|nr:hypothetical protein TNCV_1338931 [Trichonephila clavipes]